MPTATARESRPAQVGGGGQPQADIFDDQHDVQIGLIDMLADCLSSARRMHQVEEVLAQLIRQSEIHFLSEALLMRLHEFPNYEDHRREHEEFLAGLEDLRCRVNEGSPIEAPLQDLRRKLLTYIAEQDRAFYRFLDTHAG